MHIFYECSETNIFRFFSNQLGKIAFLNVQTLPESPTQDSTDAVLSFFVDMPRGTMSLDLLTVIFTTTTNVLISQPFSVESIITPNPHLTVAGD